jgi:hypothetical protein
MQIAKLLVASLALSLVSFSQDSRGQIQGRVNDPSGAVVVAAAVRAVNTATNVSTSVTTNSTGDFLIPFLVPGAYRVEVDATGFKHWIREGIGVQVNDRVTLNISLTVGAATETVSVNADAPLVDAASASLGTVVDQRRVSELPLKDGNPIMLSSLSPGVMNLSTGGWSRPFDNASPSAIAISGNRTGTNEFTLDGAPNTTGAGGNVAYIPPAGVVEEFKIQTATFDAANGFASGAVVNVSLKAGTNQLHGQLYEFFQNPVLNANSFFNNLSRQPRANIRQHRFGGSASGPIYIPKLYDGRNKSFWMYGYEGIKDTFPRQTVTDTVPTDAQRRGDFSQLLSAGSQYQIYDPATIAAVANGRFSRQPLPGNVIPQSRIAPLALSVQKYWPAANLPGTRDGSNNYTILVPDIDDFWSHVFRVDHNISEKNRFFIRGDANRRRSDTENRYGNDAYGTLYFRRNLGAGFDHVYIFRPNLLLNTRYSYTKYYDNQDPRSMGTDIKALGFSDAYVSQVKSISPTAVSLPYINVGGFAPLSPSGVSKASRDIHSVAANVNNIIRNHSLKYGYETRLYRDYSINLGLNSGRFDYAADWTRGPLDNSPAAPLGQSLASFMFGLPTGGFVDFNDTYAQQAMVHGFYLQDDWKLSPKLTLTLGLRYELGLPTTERFNRTVRGFDAKVASPLEAAARANYARSPIADIDPANFRVPGGLTFAGVNGEQRGLWNSDRNNFSPRFGFAYQLDRRTALRGGFGRFYDLDRQTVNQSGFSRRTQIVPSLNNGVNFLANTANPYPGGIDRPTGTAQGLLTFAGQGVGYFNPNLRTPYAHRWQFSLQREVWKDMALELAYVGTSSSDLRISRAINPIPRQYMSTSLTRDQPAIDALSRAVANPFYPALPGTGLAATNTSRGQLLRPFPQFTGVSVTDNDGYSNYHSLQTRLERRFSRGYTLMAAYTWSKFMEGIGYLNETDPNPEYVVSDQDRSHRFVTSGVWELPVGRGKLIGGSMHRAADKLFGGWQVQGIYQYQGGAPLGFGNAIFNGDLKAIPLASGQRSIGRWFNTDAGFERNAARQLGSNLRYMPSRFSGIRGDGIDNWDLSVIKNTHFTERIYLQFRAEFLNAFNHAQFSAPNTTPSSTAFGTVTETSQMPRLMQFGLKLFF